MESIKDDSIVNLEKLVPALKNLVPALIRANYTLVFLSPMGIG